MNPNDIFLTDLIEALKEFEVEANRIESLANRTLCKVFRAFDRSTSYGLKCYPAFTPVGLVETEVRLVDHLSTQLIEQVPFYLTGRGGVRVVRMTGGHHLVAYRWIEGEHRRSYDESSIRSAARLMRDLHRGVAGSPAIARPDDWLWDDMRTMLTSQPFSGAVKLRLDAVARAGRPWSTHQNGLILCHGDFALNNLIWKGDQCNIIDFTNSIIAPPEWDVAVLLTDLMLDRPWATSSDSMRATVKDAYEDHIDDTVLDRLLDSALPQRAIFKCYGVDEPSRAKIISRLLAIWK